MNWWVVGGLGLIVFVAAMSAITIGGMMLTRKVRKEVGLWVRRRKRDKRPAPPEKKYRLE